MDVIKPTVGRVVHYYAEDHEIRELAAALGEPLAAHIATVWSDTCVNLMVIDGNGNPHSRTSVHLSQPGDRCGQTGPHCQWMPYQLGQAERTREAETRGAEHDEFWKSVFLTTLSKGYTANSASEEADTAVHRLRGMTAGAGGA